MPNKTRRNFRVTRVKSIGIQGQPQLTFDSREAAESYLATYPEVAENMSVGWTNKDYMCYKIPVTCGDGTTMDAWLPVSNFPSLDSQRWEELVNMFPDYFEKVNIRESTVNTNFDDSMLLQSIATDTDTTDDEKCQELFQRR